MLIDLDIIKGLSVCAGLDLEQATSFFEQCRTTRLLAGGDLIEGGPGTPALHFVRAGELGQIVGDHGDTLLVRTLVRGDMVATPAIFGCDGPQRTRLVALRPCTVLSLPEVGLDRLAGLHHPVVANIEIELLRAEARELEVRQTVLARFAGGAELPRPSSIFAPALRSILGPLSTPEARWTPASEANRMLQRRLGLVATPVDDLVAVLSSRLECRAVARGEVLAAEGRSASTAFVVRKGTIGRYVRSRIKGQVQLGQLGPGSLGGVIPAITGQAATATAVAEEDSVILRVRQTDLAAALIDRTPEAARLRRAMLATLADWQEQLATLLHGASHRGRQPSTDSEASHASAS